MSSELERISGKRFQEPGSGATGERRLQQAYPLSGLSLSFLVTTKHMPVLHNTLCPDKLPLYKPRLMGPRKPGLKSLKLQVKKSSSF